MSHVHEQLSSFLDRALEPTELVAIEQHLRDCAECRTHLAELEATVNAVSGLKGPATLPAGYYEKLERKRVAQEAIDDANEKAAEGRDRLRRRVRRAAQLAVALFAVAAGAVAFKRFMPGLFNQVSSMISGAAGSLGSQK